MHVVILGNGISGITTARWVRKLSDHKITVISSETAHFYSRTALMYIYMGHMRFEDTKPYEDWFWEKNRIDLVLNKVEQIDFNGKSLHMKSGSDIHYDKLVLAVGSKSNKFGWPGQDLEAVGGLYNYQDLVQMEAHSPKLKRAVIVGGGLIGIEMAEMYHSRDIPVTMLVRESSYWDNILPAEESQLVTREIMKHHIDLRLGVNLGEILDDKSGKACAVVIKETGEKIECGYVGLTAGVSPNVDFLKNTKLDLGRGIKVNKRLESNIPDVYAVGDCAEATDPASDRRPIEAIWYTGRMMGETCAYNICGKSIDYNPGIWFNSAKFMNIEYQVYGNVANKLIDGHKTIYWEHADGTKSIRINYNQETKAIEGFNLMGIRYRHEVCEQWLAQKTHVKVVLQNLSLANFDPEFSILYEAEVMKIYNTQNGTSLKTPKKTVLNQVISFLKA